MFPNSAATTSLNLFLKMGHCLFSCLVTKWCFWSSSCQSGIPTDGARIYLLPSLKSHAFNFYLFFYFLELILLASKYFWSRQSGNMAPQIVHLLPPMHSQKVKRSLLSVLTVPISFLSINLFIQCIIYSNRVSAPVFPWIWLMSLIMSMPFILENIYSDILLPDPSEAFNKVSYSASEKIISLSGCLGCSMG